MRVTRSAARMLPGDLVLDREDVLHLPVVLRRPELVAVGRVRQPRADPHPLPGGADASLEEGPHAQALADRAHVVRLALELERRGPRHDPQGRDLGEGVDQLLRHAVAEVLLVLLRAHVHEGQDRHRRLLRGRGDLEPGRCVSARLSKATGSPPRRAESARASSLVVAKRFCGSFWRQVAMTRWQALGDGRVEVGHRHGLLEHDGGERPAHGVAGKGPPAGGHLVEDHPQRELVGAVVHRRAPRLLRGHVLHRAQQDAGGGLGDPGVGRDVRDRGRQLREAEVEDLHQAVARDHEVLGLEVPVHDAPGVGLGQGFRDLGGVVEELRHGEGAELEQLAERLALHELHGDVGRVVHPPDVVDRDDVRVVEGRGGPGLLLEPGEPLRAGRGLGPQDLDGHRAPQPDVLRAVDLAHPARAQERTRARRRRTGCRGVRAIAPE